MIKGTVLLVAAGLGLSFLLLFELHRSRGEMEHLRAEVSRLDGLLAMPAPEPRASTPQEFISHVESVFRREREDLGWTSQVRRSLQERLATGLASEARVRSLECRASLCRLELLHSSEEQYQQFMLQSLHGGSLWEGATLSARKEHVAGNG